jgi:hypothetical protein
VGYSKSYTRSGESPTTVADGPSGEFSGTLESPISIVKAPFDYPQANVVNVELK